MALQGTLISGRYRVVRPFARGANSVVYLVFDPEGHPYVLKLLPPAPESRVNREYQLAHTWKHSLINPVLERLTIENQPGLLLDYAPGEVLSKVFAAQDGHTPLERGTERRRAFLGVMIQMLEALAYIHERGVVHRDLKPENVMVTPDYSIRLIDFDLSGPIGEVFEERIALGTAGYMAPEQAMGNPSTPATDLYSLGVLMYWALSGQLPFYGTLPEVMRQHVLSAPVPPHQVRGSSVDSLDAICLMLLHKNPSERIGNALVLRGMLEDQLEGS
jgi:eukaryotic-like serine/threonine-protein kinase